jgi:orotate phosphoribosyltransferase-like protein
MTVKSALKGLFQDNRELTVKEITARLQVSKQMVHIALNQLVDEGHLEKLGRAPKTIYRRVEKRDTISQLMAEADISENQKDILQKNFLLISETGTILEGVDAFVYWCNQRNLPIEKTIQEFIQTKKKYESYYDNNGFINGMNKLQNTKGYEKIWLDQIYYLEFYAIERFGKTRLGTLLHYAKQGQNKFLMSEIIKSCSSQVYNFLQLQQADAIGYVPPTIRREVQFMKYLQTHLNISLPQIDIKKISGIIPVPQKSLSKIEERIRNAENTFAVTDQRSFKHVVLIDDAAGSGATLNQIAHKIKTKGVAKKVTGLAIVGSFKGFDVISDV